MKSLQSLNIICIFVLAACTGSANKTNENHPPLPEAMQEPKYGYLSKRGHADPVSTIYENILDKSPDMKNIDRQTRNITSEKEDSAEVVSEYLNNVDNYYKSAAQHLSNIKDSALRQKMLAVLDFSKNSFGLQSKPYTSAIDSINKNIQSINDRREVLKLILTLPVMKDYEKNNKPSIIPLNDFNEQLEKRKAILDSVIDRNGG